MSTVVYRPGENIVKSNAIVLVNTVNCVGVMGKGVALAFRQAFPSIMRPYQADCRNDVIKPGTTKLYPLPELSDRHRFWAAMATKDHWRDPSRLEWIEPALNHLAEACTKAGARSIALPPPGCGNGGLRWEVVEPIVLRVLSDFDLEIYATTTLR